jgi:hypothetical protein
MIINRKIYPLLQYLRFWELVGRGVISWDIFFTFLPFLFFPEEYFYTYSTRCNCSYSTITSWSMDLEHLRNLTHKNMIFLNFLPEIQYLEGFSQYCSFFP